MNIDTHLTTTAEVAAPVAASNPANQTSRNRRERNAATDRPEWLRLPAATHVSGLCRSTLYELITSKKIKSTCLRKRGALRGIRLISYDSLMDYIESSVEGGV